MGYKKMDRNMTFAEVDLMTSMEQGLRQKCGYHIIAETYPPFGKGG